MTNASDVFYAAGLQFACSRCGQCCTGEHGTISVSMKDIETIATRLGQPCTDFIAMYCYIFEGGYSLNEGENGDCCMLKDGRTCLIYDIRPIQCLTYPFWADKVLTEQDWICESRVCRGIGNGRLFSHREIEELLAQSQT